jgi:pimeloyl-ACP methyl ester carboxylesterase
MHVLTIGAGPRFVLVHGSVTNSVTWAPLRALADRYELVIPDRPGYPPNPPLGRIDFEEQAAELAPLLGDGAHLLGHSYGGVISLLAAAVRPEAITSLGVIEPPCFALAAGHPDVDEVVAYMSALWEKGLDDPREFLPRFSAAFGEQGQVPTEFPPEREQGVRALMAERPPWEAEIPLDELAAAGFPVLVCSSGGHPAFEAICDVLTARLAAERIVLAGGGHAVHRAPGFVELLERFLSGTGKLRRAQTEV